MVNGGSLYITVSYYQLNELCCQQEGQLTASFIDMKVKADVGFVGVWAIPSLTSQTQG